MNPTKLKLGLLLLLIVNAIAFMVRSEWNDALDSCAWILLMALYEIETGRIPLDGYHRFDAPWIRNLAILVVVFAETSYFFEGAWLDGIYSLLWLLVLALFESQSRFPAKVAAQTGLFKLAGMTLGIGMAGVIGAWLQQGAWFNAYDALLWTTAFLVIDLDLVRRAKEVQTLR
jgi:hypothetical protein